MFSFKTSCSLTNGSSTQYNLSDFFINIFGRVLMKLNSLNINKYFSSDFSRKIMIFQLGWLAEENLCIFKNLNQFCRVLSQMECLFVSWLELATLLPNDDIICFNLNFLNIYNVFFFRFSVCSTNGLQLYYKYGFFRTAKETSKSNRLFNCLIGKQFLF